MSYWIILATVMATLPSIAHADQYRNAEGTSTDRLQSVEGVNMIVTAQNFASGDEGSSEIHTAEQIQITVNGSNVKFGSQVRAVITPNCVSGEYHWGISEPTVETDLTAQTDGTSLDFTGKFAEDVMTASAIHGGEWVNCQPTLSVVIDGNWQTDPAHQFDADENSRHNFRLMNF